NRIAFMSTEAGRTFFDSSSDTLHKNFEFFSSASRFEYQGIVDVNYETGTQVTFGVETQLSTFRNNNFGIFAPPPTIAAYSRLTGSYGQDQTTLCTRLTVTGGVRLDDDDRFGTHPSYKFNAAWNSLGWDTTLRGSIGTALKAPSL